MKTLKLAINSKNAVWFGVLVDRKDRLVASAFHTSRRDVDNQLTRIAQELTGSKPNRDDHPLVHQMLQLFNGQDSDKGIRLNTEAVTAFQKRVYNALRKIPKGQVTTYGMIAKAITSGPRATGTAVSSNPWTLFIPCHRVVPSNLTVGNYSMNGRINDKSCLMKKELLKNEGVRFREDRILPSSVWRPLGA